MIRRKTTLVSTLAPALTAVALAASLAVSPAVADTQDAPNWSGLDVTDGVPLPDATGAAVEEVPLDPAVGLTSAAVQRRYVYSTVDQHGQTAASTAAVFLPHGTAPDGGWPVLAWAHGTTGLGDDCTPSAQARGERDSTFLNHWLDEGYAVVASDYVGMGTPGLMSYLNGRVTAANVVDSVTAARDLDSVGADLSPTWAVIGQSQGGGVALHVAHNASARSAQAGLDYRGAVATGAPAYIEELVLAASPIFPPVALPAALTPTPPTSSPGSARRIRRWTSIPRSPRRDAASPISPSPPVSATWRTLSTGRSCPSPSTVHCGRCPAWRGPCATTWRRRPTVMTVRCSSATG